MRDGWRLAYLGRCRTCREVAIPIRAYQSFASTRGATVGYRTQNALPLAALTRSDGGDSATLALRRPGFAGVERSAAKWVKLYSKESEHGDTGSFCILINCWNCGGDLNW